MKLLINKLILYIINYGIKLTQSCYKPIILCKNDGIDPGTLFVLINFLILLNFYYFQLTALKAYPHELPVRTETKISDHLFPLIQSF
jgi:hypothetical protein